MNAAKKSVCSFQIVKQLNILILHCASQYLAWIFVTAQKTSLTFFILLKIPFSSFYILLNLLTYVENFDFLHLSIKAITLIGKIDERCSKPECRVSSHKDEKAPYSFKIQLYSKQGML